jgi:hypothetical protein
LTCFCKTNSTSTDLELRRRNWVCNNPLYFLQLQLVYIQHTDIYLINLCEVIYLLTAIGLLPGGSITIIIYTKAINSTIQIKPEEHKWKQICNSAGHAPSLRVLT